MIEKTIDRESQQKLYVQIHQIIKDKIEKGEWTVGTLIPSEDELCKIFDVSKATVRLAIYELVRTGYLKRRQGKGTFVIYSGSHFGITMKTRLTEDILEKEVKLQREILSKGMKEPPPEIRPYLKTDESIYYMLSKMLCNNKTAYIEEAFIPHEMFPYIEKLDIRRTSLYKVLEEKSVKKIFKMVQTIEVAHTVGDLAQRLSVDEDFPLLVVHRLFLSSDNALVAYTKIQGRSDRYKIQMEFEKIR